MGFSCLLFRIFGTILFCQLSEQLFWELFLEAYELSINCLMPVKFQGSGIKKETKREREKWQKENEKRKEARDLTWKTKVYFNSLIVVGELISLRLNSCMPYLLYLWTQTKMLKFVILNVISCKARIKLLLKSCIIIYLKVFCLTSLWITLNSDEYIGFISIQTF